MIEWSRKLAALATGLTLGIIMVGAWVRLSAAGLGCTDWPACYGKNLLAGMDLSGNGFPADLLTVMTGGLALLVTGLIIIAWRNRQQPFQPQKLPLLLLPLVIIQLLLAPTRVAVDITIRLSCTKRHMRYVIVSPFITRQR